MSRNMNDDYDEEYLREHIDQIEQFQFSIKPFSIDFAREFRDRIDFGLWLFNIIDKKVLKEFRELKAKSKYIYPNDR